MSSPIIDKINKDNMKSDVPHFEIGDSVNVHVKIHEGDKDRIQAFKGVVIARDGSSATETFTVRRISHGVGVERVFPIHSLHVAKIEVLGSAHVRRAKLYYLRNLTGKRARLKAKIRNKKKDAEVAAKAAKAAEAAAAAAAKVASSAEAEPAEKSGDTAD